MPNHGNPASAAFRRLKPNELSFEPAAFLAQSVVIEFVHSTILPTSAGCRDQLIAKQVDYVFSP
jgi:hypothetical protein